MTNGIEEYDAKNGAAFLRVHHYADPGKDSPEWLAKMLTELGDRDFRREILMDDTIHEGEPVFADYVDDLHCPVAFRKRHIPVIPGAQYYGGWDCGQTLSPAFVLLQVAPEPKGMIHGMIEVIPTKPMGMSNFAPRVVAELKRVLPGRWNSVLHFGDETGRTRSGSDERSAFDVARDHGIQIMPVSNKWHTREQAVVWALTDWVTQEGDRSQWIPRFILSGLGCPVLTEALRGAYCMVPNKQHAASGPGMVYNQPAKNSYSHIADALQYPLVRIREQITSSPIRRARM